MAWTAPRTWVVGEIVTADIGNTHWRANLRYLKGLDGVPTIESGLTIDNTDGDERLLLPLLSTAECSTVLNAEGEVAFDEQTHQMKAYDGTAVRVMISGADVDDSPVNGADTVPISSNWAYDHLALLTTAGDIIYATGAGTWARLGIGTVGQVLRTNAGATAPEWATSIATKQFHVPCYTGTGGTLSSLYGAYSLNSTVDTAVMTFRIPNDYASLTSVKVIIIPVATGTFDWTAATVFGASGEAYNVHTDSTTADGTVSTNAQLLELDISAAFTGIATNDIITLTFRCDALATTTALNILGLDVKYV